MVARRQRPLHVFGTALTDHGNVSREISYDIFTDLCDAKNLPVPAPVPKVHLHSMKTLRWNSSYRDFSVPQGLDS
jgi:hypothetical protein